jgi:hypothetical protein
MTQPFTVAPQELSTPSLSQTDADALLSVVNAVAQQVAHATVSLTYKKQTKTKPRLAGEHYVQMPGVSMESQTGTLSVHKRVDNKANRRKGVVGQVYLKIKSVTRADGVEAFGWTNVRPEGITGFAILGMQERDLEAEERERAKAKAEAEAKAKLRAALDEASALLGEG